MYPWPTIVCVTILSTVAAIVCTVVRWFLNTDDRRIASHDVHVGCYGTHMYNTLLHCVMYMYIHVYTMYRHVGE